MPHISTDGLPSGQQAPLPWVLLRRLPACCRTRISGLVALHQGRPSRATEFDKQVNDFWKLLMGEFVPAIQKVKGVKSCKIYSGAGALRADIRLVAEMDHAGVYETLLRDPAISKQLGAFYGAMDLTTSTQMFIREVTPDLLKALSS